PPATGKPPASAQRNPSAACAPNDAGHEPMKRPPRSPPGCACTHAPLGGRARLNPRQPRPVTTLRLDLYAWLTYRMSYLSKPVTVPWPSLMDQFGFQLAPGPKGAYQFRTTLK